MKCTVNRGLFDTKKGVYIVEDIIVFNNYKTGLEYYNLKKIDLKKNEYIEIIDDRGCTRTCYKYLKT